MTGHGPRPGAPGAGRSVESTRTMPMPRRPPRRSRSGPELRPWQRIDLSTNRGSVGGTDPQHFRVPPASTSPRSGAGVANGRDVLGCTGPVLRVGARGLERSRTVRLGRRGADRASGTIDHGTSAGLRTRGRPRRGDARGTHRRLMAGPSMRNRSVRRPWCGVRCRSPRLARAVSGARRRVEGSQRNSSRTLSRPARVLAPWNCATSRPSR